MEAFERTLVKWVNCLKFAEPISKLEDLKNGIFLHNLQKIISRKNFPCVGTDTLTVLFKLLERHYPKFIIDNKSNIHLNDLSRETLLCIVSLILHYICIYDRIPVFTSSLCTELDTPSQLAIKNFLEKIADCAELDNATLIEAINSSVENEKAESAQEESPLQLLLKTPVSKANRLIKREQEIANLITEVELLQEEKERLEADLKAEKKKNKTLGKQVTNKNEEISQLRCEILILEDRTPPNYQDADLREGQKILRTKVETLEEIIKQNYKDYEELTNKREEDRAQLKNLESQCNMWLTKFIDSNNQLHILSEICESQEVKLKTFEKHCSELEALMEEMKPKSLHESLMEESFKYTEVPGSLNSDSFVCSEDLAHSVVDLQLKEQQRENIVLKSTVKNAEAANEELRELNNILMTERNELQNKLAIREDLLNKLSEDLKKVMVVYGEMFNKQKDLNLGVKAIEDHKEKNTSIMCNENELDKEKLSLDVINTTNFEEVVLDNCTMIKNLTFDMCKLRQEYQQITNHNQLLTVQCSDLREKLSAVTKQLEELEEDFQKSENDLELAIKDKQVALVNYIKCVATVDLFFFNYRNLLVYVYLLYAANNVLNTRISSLVRKVFQLGNDRQLLLQQAPEYYKKIEVLEAQNDHLLSCLSMANEEKEKIEDRCKQIENDFFMMKAAYERFRKLSDEKTYSQEQKTMAISHSLESALKQLETCTKEKEELVERVETFEKETGKLSEENKMLRISLEEAKTEYHTVKAKQFVIMDAQAEALHEAEHMSSQYLQMKLDMSSYIEKLENERTIMRKELDNNQKNVNEACLKVDRLLQEKLEISHSLESTLKQFESRTIENEVLSQTVESLKFEMNKLSEENKTLQFLLDEVKTEYQTEKDKQFAIRDAQAGLQGVKCSVTQLPEHLLQSNADMFGRIDQLEAEKASMQKEFENNLKKTQEAYSKIVSMNSTLDVENANIKKKIKGLSRQLEENAQIKEAYEKLLEENSKLQTERDTVKYKRLRDREEFMKVIKKDRELAEAMASKKIKEVRHDYEVKAEMMREQLLKLYNDEVKKEIQKVNQGGGKSRSFYQQQTEELRKQLSEAKYKIRMLELERELSDQRTTRAVRNSRESLTSLPEQSSQSFYLNQPENVGKHVSGQFTRKLKNISTMRAENSRRASTLPKSRFAEIKETVTRQSSVGAHANIGNLEMEDEDDDFNNKYLMDLKAGRCVVNQSDRESDGKRVSELAWRNSLMPPHLKSSYPVEAQFYSPSKFKEDDLKAGNIDLDNSQSKLLPSEKPRQKKDFGTTSYRKPGPPTPSKNARLSQQSNEIQPLRDQNERTPKRSTPSRIRMMFTGKSSSSQAKDNNENHTDTPKINKRLSLFRKQK